MEMQMALAMAMATATLPNSMPERRLPALSPPPPPPPAVALGSRFQHLSGKTHASFACNHDTTQHMAQRPDRTAPHRTATHRPPTSQSQSMLGPASLVARATSR